MAEIDSHMLIGGLIAELELLLTKMRFDWDDDADRDGYEWL
jgi:hypothetical protein